MPEDTLEPGTKVLHTLYGWGTVVSYEPGPPEPVYYVTFPGDQYPSTRASRRRLKTVEDVEAKAKFDRECRECF